MSAKKCLNCWGSGLVNIEWDKRGYGIKTGPCPKCRGTGKLTNHVHEINEAKT